MAKEKTILIKQGTFELKAPRSEVVEVSETADGICFNFKNGLSLMKTDNYMPITIKNLIKNTADNFPNTDIEIDLGNYNQPVKAIGD